MTTRSMDDIRANYIAGMGDELGASFFELYRQLVELHMLWQQYRQLFGTDEDTIQLLNKTAGLFFKVVQDELWDSVLLRISRMTDPESTAGKKNLAIRTLAPLIDRPTVRADVIKLCDDAVQAAAFAREHRNKRIAHQDHDYLSNRSSVSLSGISRSLIEDMLSKLRAVLNRIDNDYRDTTVMYEKFIDANGARVLVHKLKRLERLEAQVGQNPRSGSACG